MIDYALVEMIGATHYKVFDGGEIEYYKPLEGLFYCSEGHWASVNGNFDNIKNSKPIPPKPQVRVEYELVNLNATDGAYWCLARDWSTMDAPNLFWNNGGDYLEVDSHERLLREYKCRNLYRRVENPVWREALAEWLEEDDWSSDKPLCDIDQAFSGVELGYFTEKQFIEMCHLVAELTEKPKGEL